MNVNNVYNKILDKMDKIKESNDINYSVEKVKVGKDRCFSIECYRLDEDEYLYGENMEIVEVIPEGTIIGTEIYYQEKGEDIDCCTIDSWLNFREYVTDFIKTWL